MSDMRNPTNDPERQKLVDASDADYDAWLREYLRQTFGVTDAFMDVAVRIWWDGKED